MRAPHVCRIDLTPVGAPPTAQMLELLYDVLYREFGVARDAEWFHPDTGSVLAVAFAPAGGVLGIARILPAPGDLSRQLRQVAVTPHAQGAGVGRALVSALERRAADEGATEIWLNARDTAIAFYEALGYVAQGPVFVSELTGIPHRKMARRLP